MARKTKIPRVEELCACWDTYELIRALAEYIREEDPELTEDEAFSRACEPDLTHDFEFFLNDVTMAMESANPYGDHWVIEGRNMGWRSRSGYRTLRATREKGAALVDAVTPNSEYTLRMYRRLHSLECVVSHHDSMGEHYTITPGHACDECDDIIPLSDVRCLTDAAGLEYNVCAECVPHVAATIERYDSEERRVTSIGR